MPRPIDHGLTLRACSFSYPFGPRVLRDINLQIESPGRTLLLGPNGAGKSTLLRLVSGLYRPTRGTVTLDGRRCASREARRRVCLTTQSPVSLPGHSVQELIQLICWLQGASISSRQVRETLALLQVEELGSRQHSHLSQGQRQLVNLAVPLLLQSEVVLLDEPTAALDPLNKRLVLDQVNHHLRERIVLTSTHDVQELEDNFDRVLVLHTGRILFNGGTRDFLELSSTGRVVSSYKAVLQEARPERLGQCG